MSEEKWHQIDWGTKIGKKNQQRRMWQKTMQATKWNMNERRKVALKNWDIWGEKMNEESDII